VILDVCAVDPVVVFAAEHTELLARTSLHDREVVEQVDGPIVQPHMIVRTQATAAWRVLDSKGTCVAACSLLT
jgi:hypothetical protein